MKNTLLGLVASSLLLISCKKDEKPTYLKDEPTPIQQNISTNTPKPSLIDQSGIATTQTGSTTVTAPGMNPPHGQPGHRCEIPVGQPLNGNPAPTTQPTNTPSGTQNIQIDPNTLQPGKVAFDNSNAPVKTAPGMNPPHGEPGHRCDIPVGEPLNSKPAPVEQTSAPIKAGN